MKKKIALLLALCLSLSFSVTSFADDSGESRTVIGANLTETQITQVYKDFGIERGTVPELTVTNAEERVYLEGKVSDSTIGTRSISCVYIQMLPFGEGLDVTVKNINWCTEAMYKNALITAGIDDARVIVTAPFQVSGTAALTGIYKAYEDITGETLSEMAKDVGTQELIVSAELADEIAGVSDEQIAYLMNELKVILDETQNMTDDELRNEIDKISESANVKLNDEQKDKVVSLVRSLEKLSVEDLIAKAKGIQDSVVKMQEAAEKASGFISKVVKFFSSIASFFSRLFGNKS